MRLETWYELAELPFPFRICPRSSLLVLWWERWRGREGREDFDITRKSHYLSSNGVEGEKSADVFSRPFLKLCRWLRRIALRYLSALSSLIY